MPGVIVCPTCGKRFAARPELMGKRMRCPGCREPFTIGVDTQEEIDLAPPPPPSREPAIDTPPPLTRGGKPGRGAYAPARAAKASSSASSSSSTNWELSQGERGCLKVCGTVSIFGVVSLILPLIGLQFRQLAGADPDSQRAAGIGLIVAGPVLAGLLFVRKAVKHSAKAAKRALGWGGLGVVLLVLLVALLIWRPWAPRRPSFSSPSSPPEWTRHPMPEIRRPDPPPFKRVDYDSLVKDNGKDRVVRVHVAGPRRNWNDDTIKRVRKALTDTGAKSMTLTYAEGRSVLSAGPVADLAALEQALGFPKMTVDAAERIVTIELDAVTAPTK